MKSNLDKYVKEVISGFQLNRGRASVYCFPPISFAELVINLIDQFYTKSPGAQVFIAVDCYATRKAILDRLDKADDVSYNVKILSADYIKTTYKYDYKLIITVGINDDLETLKFLSTNAKFMLAVLTKNIMDNNFITQVRQVLPAIEVTVSNASVRADNVYSPVEEYRIGIDLSDEDIDLYKKYSEYVATCVSIFGELSNIGKCRLGDPQLGISSAEFRETIARENGWSLELDTTIEWSKQIDDIYNPNTLYERANNFYNITKTRRDLVTDNVAKLEAIKTICLDNADKKILIVSKRGQFAAAVTNYINDNTELNCLDYHDTIEDMIATDMYGTTILVKSGANKGKPKVIGAIAISGSNMRHFNEPYAVGNPRRVNCLSIKNSSSVKLKTAIDLIIFTTPFIDDIMLFKARFVDIDFKLNPTVLYKVYCRNTIEAKHLNNQKESSLITVIDDNDNFVGYSDDNDYVVI